MEVVEGRTLEHETKNRLIYFLVCFVLFCFRMDDTRLFFFF